MLFSKLRTPGQQRVSVSRFSGYDARSRTPLGGFSDMKNLCADGCGALTVRPPRGIVRTLSQPGGLISRDELIWADGTALYIGGTAAPLTLSPGRKQFVSMGAYLLIWPDKMYINTQELSDRGSMENTVTVSAAALSLCRTDGQVIADYTAGDTAPDTAQEGALWLDTAATDAVLRRYGGGVWQEEADAAIRLSAGGIGAGFTAGDTVDLTGCGESIDGRVMLLRCGADELTIAAVAALPAQGTAAEVTVKRTVPEMDYVCECGNRIWGCKYGTVDGEPVNEIYGSALGDFRNWHTFAGLSTDSYALQRGSDGPFTGCCAYLGSPLFFKESCLERLYISPTGAHEAVTLQCPGVKDGSSRTLAVVDGVLYYHGMGGVYGFDGSMPRLVSEALGEARYSDGVAAAYERQYFFSALRGGETHLFVYDTPSGQWHRQDALRVLDFAVCGGELYAMSPTQLLSMHGANGSGEGSYDWYAVTGELGMDTPENKYLQRLELRLRPQDGAVVTACISYDGGKTWRSGGTVVGSGRRVQASLLCIRPVRTPQLRIRLSGRGWCCLYSISAVYEKGSESV